MAKCEKRISRNRQVCIGSMNAEIILSNRAIVPPTSGSVDYTEDFTGELTVWANIQTKKGLTTFDRTTIGGKVVTHEFGIRFLIGVTSETWLELDAIRYDILDVENYEQRSDFLILSAVLRGTKTLEINSV